MRNRARHLITFVRPFGAGLIVGYPDGPGNPTRVRCVSPAPPQGLRDPGLWGTTPAG
jgi:hypothetical protein